MGVVLGTHRDVNEANEYEYDDDDVYVDDVDDDLTLDDDDDAGSHLAKKRARLFSLRRRNDDDDDDDDDHHHRRRRKAAAAAAEEEEAHRRRRRAIGAAAAARARRGAKVRSSRPTRPFLCGIFEIRARWYMYLGVALVEAQAFYLVFLAFRYTTFTFVYVSDALAIPSAMLFSKLIMGRRYRRTHLLGCAICISGIIVNTASDLGGGGEDGVQHGIEHVRGDVLAILGAVLLGLDDVLSEIIVNDYGGVNEMLLMKGLFGSLISVVQLGIFERDDVRDLFGRDGGGGACSFNWRMALFACHFCARAMSVAGEMQFLYISEA